MTPRIQGLVDELSQIHQNTKHITKPLGMAAAKGAVPGAAVGAALSKDSETGERTPVRGALKGAVVGGALGMGVHHGGRVRARSKGALTSALGEHGLTQYPPMSQPEELRRKILGRAKEIREATPLYPKTASAKDYGEPDLNHVQRHGKKYLAGAAAATAAGVGAHKYHNSTHAKARRRVKEVAKYWKEQGGFKGHKPRREVWVGARGTKGVPRSNVQDVIEAAFTGGHAGKSGKSSGHIQKRVAQMLLSEGGKKVNTKTLKGLAY